MTHLAATPLPQPDADLLDLIADAETPLGQDHYEAFLAACLKVARRHGGWVNPNEVRAELTVDGVLQIDPRAYSAMWSRATGPKGPMRTMRRYMVPTAGKGSLRNGNKTVPMRVWVGGGSP